MHKIKEKCFQEFLKSEYPTDPLESNAWRNAHMRKAFFAGWSSAIGESMDKGQEIQKKWVVFGAAAWDVAYVDVEYTGHSDVWRIIGPYDLYDTKFAGGHVKEGDNAFDSEQEALEKAIQEILPVRNQLNSTVDRLRERLVRCVAGDVKTG